MYGSYGNPTDFPVAVPAGVTRFDSPVQTADMPAVEDIVVIAGSDTAATPWIRYAIAAVAVLYLVTR